jgi:hypothetical protein
VPSALKTIRTVLECWRTHVIRVVQQWKIFRHSRNFVVPCITIVLEENDYPATRERTAQHCISVHGQDSDELLKLIHHPPYRFDLAFIV